MTTDLIALDPIALDPVGLPRLCDDLAVIDEETASLEAVGSAVPGFS